MQGGGHTPHCSSPAHPQSHLVTDLHLAPVLSTPHHALWYGPPVTSSPHTHTAQTHFAVRSSRTLSTQACSSQASLSLSAPHRQATLHSLLLTSARTHSTHIKHVHTAQHRTTSPPTQLPLSSTVHASPNSLSQLPARLLQTPQTAPKLNYIYSKLTLNFKPIN
jgi:hypothetical protein